MSPPVWFTNLGAFFTDGRFISLGAAMLGLFVLLFITWWIYRSLSDRNLFTLLERHGNLPKPTLGDRLLYALRYVLLFPLYSFLGFVIFSGSLVILTRPTDAGAQESMLIVALVLVGTVRIAAYVSERLAEDVAKVVPLTLLTAIMLHPTQEYLKGALSASTEFAKLVPQFAPYLAFLVVLEVTLRIAAWVAGRAGFDPASDTED
jgi:hypothetical protein